MDTTDPYLDCLCRTCMNDLSETSSQDVSTKEQQWKSIFDRIDECGVIGIAELLIQAVPQIEVQPNDLPNKICCKCLQQLLSIYRFQKMCLQSQQQMRQQISRKQIHSSIPAAIMGSEIRTHEADSHPLTSLQSSITYQNLEHSSIQEPHLETTELVVKPKPTEVNNVEIDQLQEDCRDSQGNLSEFVKSEPVEYDEPSIEYSAGAIAVKNEVLSIEFEEQQITESNVKAHRIIHDDDKPYECRHCPRSFAAESTMLKHEATHDEKNREDCDICGRSIVKRHLKEHKKIHNHNNEKNHKCDICEKSFAKIGNLRAHIRVHTNEKPYKCKYCEHSFFQNEDRIRHMRLHIGANVHRCELCPLGFPVASELQVHFKTHKNEDAETRERNMKALKEAEAKLRLNAPKYVEPRRITYECPYCPRSFTAKSIMYQHKKTHEKDNRQKDKEACDICGRSINKSYLEKHKLTHSGEKPHKCDFCEKSFTKLYILHMHKRKHTGESPYKCKYCECSFSTNDALMRHMRIHLGNNIYRCDLCPLAFSVGAQLRVHYTTHKNEDPETRERNLKALKEAEAKLQLKLSQQQLEMKAKENAKPHRIIEDKPYQCPYCPRRFRKKQYVQQHKVIHSDEKAYKCDFCEKRFTRIAILRVHMRVHTNEKPYKCKYCEQSFGHSSIRLKHMRIHFGDNVYRCELCPSAFSLYLDLREHLTTHKNEDPETRERNKKALKEAEAKLKLKAMTQLQSLKL